MQKDFQWPIRAMVTYPIAKLPCIPVQKKCDVLNKPALFRFSQLLRYEQNGTGLV